MISKLKAYVRKNVENNTTDLLIFNSVFTIAIIGLIGLITIETIMKYERTGVLALVGLFLYLLTVAVLANAFPKHISLWAGLVLYPLNLIIFPFLFLKGEGGGISSAMPSWFIFGILMTVILLKGKACACCVLLSLADYTFTMLYAYMHPEATNYIDDTFYFYEDNMLCTLIIAAAIGIILKYLTFVQTLQYKTIEENTKSIQTERNNAIKANRAKTTFLTNISHEIRTPLTDILAMTTIGRENLDDKEKIIECLDEIVNYSNQLLYLFDNTLELAEIESDALRIKENRFYFPDMISNIEKYAIKNSLMDKIDFEIIKDDVRDNFLIGDVSKIRQIIMLVLDNSFRYTNAGGKVTLEISKNENYLDGNCWYRFVIEDTGVGMDSEFIEESLFEPYVRGNDMIVRQSNGSGIGMAITKSLIEAMNGKIKVRSKKGVGTVVTIDLPLQRDTFKETNMEDKVSFRVNNVKVLVVDDDEISVEITKRLLNEMGAETVLCNTAEAALDILNNSAVDEYKLAFFDIMLPGMDGYAAARTIRSIDREDISNLPLIALTANAFSLAEEKTVLSGMNEHIAKPVDVTEFYEKIYRYLAKYSV